MDEMDRVQEIQQARLDKQLAAARARVPEVQPGKLAPETCEDCGEDIPMPRRQAVPWTTRCTFCQSLDERQ